ncbi:Carboxy-terminal processing protease CtpB precursor [uncultured Bacteroides sp.]|uniref:S41 family peptidase n=1 Tax=Bacteroides cellulolyticus TaxID=2981780 RepID=UPI0008234E08|nr:S41 family peptidase [Bacteroides cellulolyticus]MCU6772678.1 S41 family peptidase [Bacteroides cellulolyticus]SCI52517.1 Carboxy-terminal processing protease CtpB precursor [uncultured Bacteroides sp.]
MDLNRLKLTLSCLIISGYVITGCTKEEGNSDNSGDKSKITEETRYANRFAREALEIYYYWNEEISKDLNQLDPEKNSDPIATVEKIRYHDGTDEIDKWTMLTDNMDEFTSSVEGVTTTYGYTPKVYLLSENSNEVIAAVAFVSENSPAEKAGIKRGDLIYKIDGKTLTTENYLDLFYSSQIKLSMAKLVGNTITPTTELSLEAVKTYENPILCDSVYNLDGKKVGYLAYSSFDLKSIPELINICKEFKNEGIKELILDLRYNGGGYVITENVLASMFAPQVNVTNKDVFEKEDYNEFFTKYYEQEGISTITRFQTEYNYEDMDLNVSTKDANIGLEKIYGIITGNSASASEALLSGLMPYMDIELIGEQSHGKYCTGWMLAAEDAYDKVPQVIKDWGIYVMVSIYKNVNDETPCMPNGLKPNVEAEVKDNPLETYQLGDENEAMLRVALEKAGKVYPASRTQETHTADLKAIETPKKANFGRRIIIPSQSRMPGIE